MGAARTVEWLACACDGWTPKRYRSTLQREWSALDKTARLRRAGAERLLEHLLACLPAGRAASICWRKRRWASCWPRSKAICS